MFLLESRFEEVSKIKEVTPYFSQNTFLLQEMQYEYFAQDVNAIWEHMNLSDGVSTDELLSEGVSGTTSTLPANYANLTSRMQAYNAAGTPEKIFSDYRSGKLGISLDSLLSKLTQKDKTAILNSKQEMVPMIYKILIRAMKSPTRVVSIVSEEFSLQFNSFDEYNFSFGLIALIPVVMVNTIFFSILSAKFGKENGMMLTAMLIAPITEEIARFIDADNSSKAFTSAINIYETITYTIGGLQHSACAGLATLIARLLISCPLHARNSENLLNNNSTFGRIFALINNVAVHAIFNVLASIAAPLLFILAGVYNTYRVSSEWNNFD